MEQEILDKYKKAGSIAAEAKKFAISIAKPGTKLLYMADEIENFIKNKGCGIAFPVNLCLNEIAAHYTPNKEDETIFNDGDILKIDLGVHVDGYIADTAITVGKSDMIKVAEDAVKNAIKLCKPGMKVSEISSEIVNTIESSGFNSVKNLTGHSIDKYSLHSGFDIPNIRCESDVKLENDQVIAIEPFVTSGIGLVKNSEPISIFTYVQDSSVRLFEARKILHMAKEEYHGLPFAKRWLQFSKVKTAIAIRQLQSMNAIMASPPLREVDGAKVAQFEETIIVNNNPIVTTKINEE